ncbi:hypothetical protein PFISCL1PPCAC_24260, partial [Pristionchus fissidentatus]
FRMLSRAALLFALVAFATSGLVKRDATPAKRVVGVKGILVCGQEPAKDVVVKLFRVNHPLKEKKEDLTQVLDEGKTGPSGMFHLEGNTNGFALNETTIDGTLSIYHSCDEDAAKAAKNGYRRVNVNIPEEYVTLGAKAKKAFDIGTLNLQVIYSGEKTVKLANPDEKKN